MDLWPEDIQEPINVKSPVTILKEQAALLGKRTNNLVTAEVSKKENNIRAEFEYLFFIVSTSLNYRYKLFSIEHNITLYPLRIITDTDLIQEVTDDETASIFSRITINDEEEFYRILQKIFGSTKVKRIISTLMRMIKGDTVV